MKTKSMTMLAMLLLPLMLAAQLTPMFETTFFFEDAVGNRDTITIGFDTLANEDFNPQFGEVSLTNPFDSVFEVRGVHSLTFNWGQGNPVMSKRIITGAEEAINLPNCFLGGAILFLVHAKHQPFKIQWEQEVFGNLFCLAPSFLTPDQAYEMIWPWDWLALPERRWTCTSTDGEYELSLGNEFLPTIGDIPEVPYTIIRPIEGASPDTIFGVVLQFMPSMIYSPCQFVIGSDEPVSPQLKSKSGFSLFPNPATDWTVLRRETTSGELECHIFTSTGQLVEQFMLPEDEVESGFSVSELPAGLYFVSVRNGKSAVVQKLVKQR